MSALARQVCPTCGTDDDYIAEIEGPGLWRLTCSNHPAGQHYSWVTTGQGAFDHSSQDGLAASLGLYDDLPVLVSSTDPWLEYGIIEYRYALAHPDTYLELVDRYGHIVYGPKRYTASAFIGRTLGEVSRRGDLSYKTCKATGRWSYNSDISAWGPIPASTDPKILSWADFAINEGFDPQEWPPLA